MSAAEFAMIVGVPIGYVVGYGAALLCIWSMTRSRKRKAPKLPRAEVRR